jgi:hypothetical protein
MTVAMPAGESNLTWTSEGPPVPEREIDALEQRLGTTLPAAYRRFLLERDGGCPHPSLFDVPSHPEGFFNVQLFLGVAREVKSSRLDWNAQFSHGLFEKGWLPIAVTDTDDLIVLHLSEPETGRIGFFDAQQQQLFESAVNLERFLSSLYAKELL